MMRKTKKIYVANSLGFPGGAGIFTAGVFCLGVSDSRVNKKVAFCCFPGQADSAFADSFTFLL